MLLNNSYLNNEEIHSDLYYLLGLSSGVDSATYTDLQFSGITLNDTILEVSDLIIGIIYIVSTAETLVEVGSYTDFLLTTISDSILDVDTYVDTYLPGPGNELDFITSVDSFIVTTAYIVSVLDTILDIDNTIEIISFTSVDEDTIFEVSDYASTAAFIESSVVDVITLIDFREEFTSTDVIKSIDDYEANTYVSNVEQIPIHNLLPEKFLSVPLYSDFLSVFNTQIVENVHSLIDNLRRLRTPTLFEIEYAESIAGSLGFYQDITNKTESQKRRLIESLCDFYSRNGTISTFDFLSFVADESISLKQLYTQDYISFSTPPGGQLQPAGSWYLTNIVDLEYSITETLDNDEITKRFYQVAPVPLVLRNISQSTLIPFVEYNLGYVHVEIEYVITNGDPI